ncbi:MAG TPA: hypothetical protein VFX98_00900, partial [Longimicrobiaceae bacterium]|nr:hypothetical protein [Longimicrobiaceae bacterium]
DGVRRSLPRAAVLAVGFAGVAAAATLPGSPLREAIERVVVSRPARPEPPAPVVEAPRPAPVAVEGTAPLPEAGVSILPEGGSVRVQITGAAPGLRVRTRLVAGSRVDVRATGAAADARFRTASGRVEVVGAGTGEVMVDLPRSARAAYVEVNGRVYAAKDGGQLRARVAPAGGTPEFPLFVVPAPE